MALRVASVSPAKFEDLIGSDSPPNVTRLAELGRNAQPPEPSIARPDPVRAASARKMFSSIQEFCEQNDPAELARAFTSQGEKRLRDFALSLDAWLDRFMAHLNGDE